MSDYMKHMPGNWSNCSMKIQDVVNPTLNITAEVPAAEINAFRRYCKEYQAFMKEEMLNNTLQIQKLDFVVKAKVTDDDRKWREEILEQASEYMHRSPQRISWEKTVLATLTQMLLPFDASVELTTIGSSAYGIGGADTNFNIAMSIGMYFSVNWSYHFCI